MKEEAGAPDGTPEAQSSTGTLRAPIDKKAPLVCIIGGGGTGAATAYDLSLRGLRVVLLEQGELTSGTTGRHHGQIHCGARYAVADRAIARECYAESLILRKIVPDALEYNGGLFVALDDEDAAWAGTFETALAEAGIPAARLDAPITLRLEPALAPSLRFSVRVPDGTFDAFRVPLSFFAAAQNLGAAIRPWCEVVALERESGRVTSVRYIDRSARTAREETIRVDYTVNATGAWAGDVGALAGADIPVTPAPGAMLAVKARLCDHVVSRLRPAGDGDILVPQRGLSIIGSTQRELPPGQSPGHAALRPLPEEIGFLRRSGALLVPAFAEAPIHAAWAAARPLAGRGQGAAGRSLSRDFSVLDHAAEGIAGMCSITGGKATVLRAMAEKTADLVCRSLGITAACRTADYRLPSWREFYRRSASAGGTA